MFLATLVMVAGVTLTTLSSSLGSGSAPSFSISCFSIRTQRSWHFMKGTEVEALSNSSGSSSSPRGWGSRENDRGIQIVTVKGPNCLKPLSFKAGSSCVAEVLLRVPLRWKGWLHLWHLRESLRIAYCVVRWCFPSPVPPFALCFKDLSPHGLSKSSL